MGTVFAQEVAVGIPTIRILHRMLLEARGSVVVNAQCYRPGGRVRDPMR
jgi:hypothetical protein